MIRKVSRVKIIQDRLAIAERSLKDRSVTTVSLACVLVSCVVDVWLGCIGVVLNTVRESVTSDSKENEQTDADSRLFSKAFPVRRCTCSSAEREGLST